MKIKKKSGHEVEFSEKKVHDSIIHAGGKEETAKSISANIKPQQGMMTSDVRSEVITGLAKKEPEIAKKFKIFKK